MQTLAAVVWASLWGHTVTIVMRNQLQSLYSFFYVTLLVLGVAGVTHSIVMDGGLLDFIFSKIGLLVDYELLHPIMLIPTTIGAWLVGYLWFSGRISHSKKSGLWASMLNFLLILVGASYAVILIR